MVGAYSWFLLASSFESMIHPPDGAQWLGLAITDLYVRSSTLLKANIPICHSLPLLGIQVLTGVAQRIYEHKFFGHEKYQSVDWIMTNEDPAYQIYSGFLRVIPNSWRAPASRGRRGNRPATYQRSDQY